MGTYAFDIRLYGAPRRPSSGCDVSTEALPRSGGRYLFAVFSLEIKKGVFNKKVYMTKSGVFVRG